jgi:single-stranded-DNA-specific exonuclease
MAELTVRKVPAAARAALESAGLHPVLARIYAARGVTNVADLATDLADLIAPARLANVADAAMLLADAIESQSRLMIVADYDCDGATACAVGMRALREFGADVEYIVPNRFEYGYGLTPEIVGLAAQRAPDLLITVDNGIASVEGVAAANELGIATLITDHHLPGAQLPDAACIVNPNQAGDDFPSKHLAGVGVMFYVMLQLRAELRERGAFNSDARGSGGPNLASLLDLVALGTVADVVRLDRNNRVLVEQGLKRMRAGKAQAGIEALFSVAGRDPRRASSFDLGFVCGPRLNAAGRLSDMGLGIECLITDDRARALNIAAELDRLNRERRDIEAGMQEQAAVALESFKADTSAAVSLFDPQWHQGVVGILASRIKDRVHRPAIAFARADPGNAQGEIKGSGRSIPGLHLRDALDMVSKREPGLILKFGGHAAAAGLSLRETDFARFRDSFEQVARELIAENALTHIIETDGPIETAYLNLQTARMLEAPTWGQGFPEPRFLDEFEVKTQRLIKDKHLKLKLVRGGLIFDAIQFNATAPLPQRVRAAYRLVANEFNGVANAELVVEYWEPIVA